MLNCQRNKYLKTVYRTDERAHCNIINNQNLLVSIDNLHRPFIYKIYHDKNCMKSQLSDCCIKG